MKSYSEVVAKCPVKVGDHVLYKDRFATVVSIGYGKLFGGMIAIDFESDSSVHLFVPVWDLRIVNHSFDGVSEPVDKETAMKSLQSLIDYFETGFSASSAGSFIFEGYGKGMRNLNILKKFINNQTESIPVAQKGILPKPGRILNKPPYTRLVWKHLVIDTDGSGDFGSSFILHRKDDKNFEIFIEGLPAVEGSVLDYQGRIYTITKIEPNRILLGRYHGTK